MPEIIIKAEEIFKIGDWPFTNAIILSFVSVAILITIALTIKSKISIIPKKLQSVLELLIEEILSLMDSVLGNRHLSERYFPLIATIFLFILTSNWLGLLPGVGAIGVKEHGVLVPLFRSPASDLNFTLALAIITVFSVNLLGVLAVGFKSHFSKFFNFESPIMFFTGILEFVSEFVKIISFSFRLFGNVFAGEVLLTIIGFLVPYFVPLPFMFLEVFVGFIQAFIFSILALLSLGMAVSHSEHH